MTKEEFGARYGGVYEHSPWVAERAYDGGAQEGEDLAERFARVVERAGEEMQLALLRAHPDLAGRLGTTLTAHSASEQQGAGLDRCTAEEFDAFTRLNERYRQNFGFPFIIAVKGLDRAAILKAFRARVERAREEEFRTALGEVHKIAALRLAGLAAVPAPGSPPPREAISVEEVHGLALAALTRAGADEENARAIADTVAAAERDGSESHGLFRLPGYVAGLSDGRLNGASRPRRLKGPDAAVIVDGDGGAASVAYDRMLPQLEEVTRAHGIGVLALRNTIHFAAMWHEVEWLAERGLAAFACTANFPYLAPHGGRRPFFGTNPIAFAFPFEPHPVVFDFAAAAMARGDIMLAARDGRTVAEGVGVDHSGEATTDPQAILEGAQLPFGGHKGSAIALMVELLAAGAIGEAFSDEASPYLVAKGLPSGGVFVLALSPDALGGDDARHRAGAWLTRLAAEPGVRLPGTRRHTKRASGDRVDVDAALLATVRELAGEGG